MAREGNRPARDSQSPKAPGLKAEQGLAGLPGQMVSKNSDRIRSLMVCLRVCLAGGCQQKGSTDAGGLNLAVSWEG